MADDVNLEIMIEKNEGGEEKKREGTWLKDGRRRISLC